MKRISADVLASMEFSVSYQHNGIQHTDGYYGQRINLWRDILPSQLLEELQCKQAGDQVVLAAKPGTLVAARDERSMYHVQQRQISPLSPQVEPIQPRLGRFYPLGILNKVAGVYPDNTTPFRCVAANGDSIKADANHPLTDKAITFKANVKDVREKFEEHGGTSIDWTESTLNGPGMQARVNDSPPLFLLIILFAGQTKVPTTDFMTTRAWCTTLMRRPLIRSAGFMASWCSLKAKSWI